MTVSLGKERPMARVIVVTDSNILTLDEKVEVEVFHDMDLACEFLEKLEMSMHEANFADQMEEPCPG